MSMPRLFPIFLGALSVLAIPATASGKDLGNSATAFAKVGFVHPADAPIVPLQGLDYRLPVAGTAPVTLTQEDLSGAPAAPQPEEKDRLLVRSPRTPSWNEIRSYEIAYQALNLVDAVQTAVALRSGRVREANPLLGDNPSTITVIGYKAAVGGVHYAMTRWIMREHPRFARLFQYASIAYQGSAVTWNLTQIF